MDKSGVSMHLEHLWEGLHLLFFKSRWGHLIDFDYGLETGNSVHKLGIPEKTQNCEINQIQTGKKYKLAFVREII